MKAIGLKLLLGVGAMATLLYGPQARSQTNQLAGASSWNNTQQWEYLGGALSLEHCRQIAGSRGYALAAFGGYSFNGVQYVYLWNGCFGAGAGGGVGAMPQYDVIPSGNDLQACAQEIEWQFGNRVRVQVDNRRRSLRVRSHRPILNDLCRIECVDRAYRTNPTSWGAPTSCQNQGGGNLGRSVR